MYMDTGMDDGDIISQESIEIKDDDNVKSIHDKLSIIGRDLLLKTLPSIFDGTNERIKQDYKKVTFAYNIDREEEKLDFTASAREVYNHIRGLYPYPIAYTTLNGEVIKICESRIGDNVKAEVSTISNIYNDGIGIKCKDKEIIVTKLKPSGKNEMSAKDYINGKKKENLLGAKLC